jgi:hypothetical protein
VAKFVVDKFPKDHENVFSDAALSDIVFFILQSICCPNLVVEEVSISLIIDFNVSKHDCDDLLTMSMKNVY